MQIKRIYLIEDSMPQQTKWLLRVMNYCGMNMTKFGKKTHLSRQYVNALVQGRIKLKYAYISMIVSTFNTGDDPEEILKWIEEDEKEGVTHGVRMSGVRKL